MSRRTQMTTVRRTIAAPPGQVFDQLADGWIYSAWVVGASHIRDVDSDWPAVGTCIHHRVGPWPFSVDDVTEVVEVESGSSMVLHARAWPVGEARVELRIEPEGSGSVVTMSEAPTSGAGSWIDNPLQRFILRRRNIESLARLSGLAERRPT